MSETTAETPSAQVCAWLIERVAFYLETQPECVVPDADLVEIGIDSVYALMLSGDIEEKYGLRVEPTVAWDNPTVDALARYLITELGIK